MEALTVEAQIMAHQTLKTMTQQWQQETYLEQV